MAATGRESGSEHTRAPATGRLMQIGEVAERVGLSIRTIRHYEEAGLIVPSARSEGGFRLYTEPDLSRLAVVKRMKPLGFTLDEMRDLLTVLDALDTATGTDRTALLDRLAMFRTAATARVTALRDQLAMAEAFAGTLRDKLDHHSGHRERRQQAAAPDDGILRDAGNVAEQELPGPAQPGQRGVMSGA